MNIKIPLIALTTSVMLALGLQAEPTQAEIAATKAEKLYKKLDTDHSGSLSHAELEAHKSGTQLIKRFEKFDANEDGEISTEEYIALASKAKKKKSEDNEE